MGKQVIRFRSATPGGHTWAIVEGALALPIDGSFATTRELIERGLPALATGALPLGAPLPLRDLELLSPVTHPCRVIAQATNYGDHRREVGLDPGARSSNVLFRKSSAAISGPKDAIVRPSHVRLLDYEIELGLVVGRRTSGPTHVDAERLGDFIVGLVIANDVSARDVQVPEGQFYKGKSYRTFCPLGPYLFVPGPGELELWPELELTLRVNGEIRQKARAGEMIHRPAETLTEILSIEDLDPGDAILTGTPGGVALAPPKKPLRSLAELLPESAKWRMFVEGQAKNPRYLKPGDRIESTIRSPDGRVDLGVQENLVR
ncbi:MAG TPA: fumarylacetoacetate hydrolase family protein [Polyangiaceae bacterium]|nr:fumarylacetoacetate hydrolase family protein [Polyangiaceae bacterium]